MFSSIHFLLAEGHMSWVGRRGGREGRRGGGKEGEGRQGRWHCMDELNAGQSIDNTSIYP
jgi:hypothetical protein